MRGPGDQVRLAGFQSSAVIWMGAAAHWLGAPISAASSLSISRPRPSTIEPSGSSTVLVCERGVGRGCACGLGVLPGGAGKGRLVRTVSVVFVRGEGASAAK